MRTKQDTRLIVEALKNEYIISKCGLDYESAWQLLVAVRLSAQCTDARVNIITPILFEKYPTVYDMAKATEEEISEIVKPCGFYRSKARDIYLATHKLIEDFKGEVPCDMEQLLSLPGVGRKSANLIRGDIFGLPAIVADTHCIRLSNRIGFVKNVTVPEKVEAALWKVVPPEESNDFCHRLVLHGRAVCTARKPMCEGCCLNTLCRTSPYYKPAK